MNIWYHWARDNECCEPFWALLDPNIHAWMRSNVQTQSINWAGFKLLWARHVWNCCSHLPQTRLQFFQPVALTTFLSYCPFVGWLLLQQKLFIFAVKAFTVRHPLFSAKMLLLVSSWLTVPLCVCFSPFLKFFLQWVLLCLAFGHSVTMKFCEATLLAAQDSSLLGQLWSWELMCCSWSRHCSPLFPLYFGQVIRVQIYRGPCSVQDGVLSSVKFLYNWKTPKWLLEKAYWWGT